MKNKHNILLVEVDELYIKNISNIISTEPRFVLNESFNTSNSLFKYLQKNNSVELIILSIDLPEADGISIIKSIKKTQPSIKILVTAKNNEDEQVFVYAKAGANGYLLKTDSDEKILKSIHDLLDGGGALNASAAAKMLKYFEQQNINDKVYLSSRELHILKHFTDGKTKKEIATCVDRSIHTVDTHIRSIYKKLKVNSRAVAVSKAIALGII